MECAHLSPCCHSLGLFAVNVSFNAGLSLRYEDGMPKSQGAKCHSHCTERCDSLNLFSRKTHHRTVMIILVALKKCTQPRLRVRVGVSKHWPDLNLKEVTVRVGKFCFRNVFFFFLVLPGMTLPQSVPRKIIVIVLGNELSSQRFYNIQTSMPARVNCYHLAFSGVFKAGCPVEIRYFFSKGVLVQ